MRSAVIVESAWTTTTLPVKTTRPSLLKYSASSAEIRTGG